MGPRSATALVEYGHQAAQQRMDRADRGYAGPAAYTFTTDEKGREANMAVMSDGEKMKSSAFASNSAQRGKFALPQAANPGPGTYSPDEKTQVPGIGNLISKTGRDHHFVSDNLDGVGADSTTQAHVGPDRTITLQHNPGGPGQAHRLPPACQLHVGHLPHDLHRARRAVMGSLVVYYGTLIDVSRINDLEGGIRFSLRYGSRGLASDASAAC